MTWMGFTLPLYMVNLWSWHYPPAFDAALRNDLIHDLQHLSFFISGVLFWWRIINPAPRVHGYIPYGFRILYVIAATLPTMLPVMARGLVFDRDLNQTTEIKRIESTARTFKTKKQAEKYGLELCKAWVDKRP